MYTRLLLCLLALSAWGCTGEETTGTTTTTTTQRSGNSSYVPAAAGHPYSAPINVVRAGGLR